MDMRPEGKHEIAVSTERKATFLAKVGAQAQGDFAEQLKQSNLSGGDEIIAEQKKTIAKLEKELQELKVSLEESKKENTANEQEIASLKEENENLIGRVSTLASENQELKD